MALSSRAKAEELERLLAGASVDGGGTQQLGRLVALAEAITHTAAVPRPSNEFRASLRERLLDADLQAAPTVAQRVRGRIDDATARWKHSARAAVASAVASSLIGTTGMAVAAQSAMPGDLLYGMKRGTEAVRLAFAATDVESGRLHLAFARERLDEITLSAAERSDADLGPVFIDMDEASATGANHILQAASFGSAAELTAELAKFTTQQRERLLVLADALPAALRPAVERSLEVLRRIDLQSGIAMDPSCVICQDFGSLTGAPLPARVVLPGEGPAAATDGCDCAGDNPQPAPRDPDAIGDSGGDDTSDPAQPGGEGIDDDPDAQDDAPPPDDDAADDLDVVPTLPGPLDDVGDVVDDTVNDVVDDVIGETGTDDVASEVNSVIDDLIGDDSGTLLDDGGSLIDDLLPSDAPTGGLLP
jgi:hypothetical protein